MSGNCNIPHPLKREGTYQWQRFPNGLQEGFFKPDNRTAEQLLMQVAEYASFIKYYDSTLNEWGNWESFYEFLYDYPAKKLKIENIDSLINRADTPPHLGLLLSFLKTFQITRDEFNRFTNRHLDFYYNDVLQLARKAAVADKVPVLFEPEKNTVQAKVESGRELNAGKDAAGKELVYKTTREIIVNQVGIAKKKTVYADNIVNGIKGKPNALHIAADAASENSFVQNNVRSWHPFGTNKNKQAQIGFAVSSPMLLAKEGRRRLSIEIDGGASLPRSSLTALFTGPKGWIEAEVDITPGIDNNSSSTSKRYLLVKIDESLPAIAAYDEKVHQENLGCIYPVVKLLLKNDEDFPDAYDFFTALKFTSFKKIVMNVEGVRSYTISGENGKLNPLQAFKPFGNNPVRNKSFFTIGCSEAFNKYLKTFHLAANWKGAPGNMAKYYETYKTYLSKDANNPFSADSILKFNNQWSTFDQGNVPGKLEILNAGKWEKVAEDTPNQYTARKARTYNTYHVNNKIRDSYDMANSKEYIEESRWGFARVTLQYNFGHQIFPLALTYNVINKDPLPPQPYTPEFNSLHLDYVLEDIIDVTNKPEHQFIQLHPFGSDVIISKDQPVIVGDYNKNGQLFIGLSGCSIPQTVNLYIARLDGTEDIDAEIREKAEWYYLSGSSWIKFKFEEITVNTTHDFTASGFVSFAIPAAAILPNTLMGENLVWIKAVSETSFNAYPSVIDVHANAVEAVFDDHGNDPYHLQTALPAGTIAKPVIKIEGVKAASQPYASNDGAMAEQKEQFYTRISERLRHKNRSWSIWDHEHLVLEKFPSIYKLKCISHATQHEMHAPGNVLCVALPATINIAEKDLLQPRISKAVLTAAKEYIRHWMTTFAHVEFINPLYEPVSVKCSVKMRAGFDENYYATQLNRELQEYISPWILNKNSSPSFGGKLYASGIINFIEERPYVDYLTNFEAFKLENDKLVSWKEFVAGSNETVILTSVAQHEIDTNAIC
jgi:Baseplate J-like protein